jgi:hydrogenase maturation protease
MNTKLIDAVAKAVLYEGYMLYPYRPSSVKNRQRFNFGVLYPKSYADAQAGSDGWSMQTECLIEGASPTVEVKVRFLKLISRTRSDSAAFDADARVQETSNNLSEAFRDLDSAPAPWQEAVEHEIALPLRSVPNLAVAPLKWEFSFPAKKEGELVRDANGRMHRIVERRQEAIWGSVEIMAAQTKEDLIKLTVRVKNLTIMEENSGPTRDCALMRSLVSAHTLLGVTDGEFVSLLEPHDDLKDLVASCQNQGTWPVLVGAAGERGTMLSSPIILYDYPQIAPESPGDLFDGTEIDEILALRILTMTDEEKREMRNTDDRARALLERTESLPMEHLAKLHGTLRDLRVMEVGLEEEGQ